MNKESKEFTEITVGEEYELFNIGNYKNIESGMVFESLEGMGYFINIYMADMQELEVNIIRNMPIVSRVMRDTPMLMMPVIRFGNTPIMFEILYDPTLYKDKRSFQLILDNNMVTIVAIDSVTNIVKAIRTVSMPKKLRELWIRSWTHAFDEENFSLKYTTWVNDISNRYSLSKLWNIGIYTGKFGEE